MIFIILIPLFFVVSAIAVMMRPENFDTVERKTFWWNTWDGLKACSCTIKKNKYFGFKRTEVTGYSPYQHPEMIEYLKNNP